jgi:hypothetical protein
MVVVDVRTKHDKMDATSVEGIVKFGVGPRLLGWNSESRQV